MLIFAMDLHKYFFMDENKRKSGAKKEFDKNKKVKEDETQHAEQDNLKDKDINKNRFQKAKEYNMKLVLIANPGLKIKPKFQPKKVNRKISIKECNETDISKNYTNEKKINNTKNRCQLAKEYHKSLIRQSKNNVVKEN